MAFKRHSTNLEALPPKCQSGHSVQVYLLYRTNSPYLAFSCNTFSAMPTARHIIDSFSPPFFPILVLNRLPHLPHVRRHIKYLRENIGFFYIRKDNKQHEKLYLPFRPFSTFLCKYLHFNKYLTCLSDLPPYS